MPRPLSPWRPHWTPGPRCRYRCVPWLLLVAGRDDRDGLTERRQRLVVGEVTAIVGKQFRAGAGGSPPSSAGQVVDDVAALSEIEQLGQVDVEAEVAPAAGHGLRAFGQHLP